jgi:HK97 gp10 family phage protein
MQQANERLLSEGLDRLNGVLRAAYSTQNNERTMAKIGLGLRKMIVRELSQPGSGETYTRGSVSHTASAPGQPPAVDTGRLRSSITFVPGADARGPYVDVGTNVEYAPYLEFGTRKMASRPFFRTAVEKYRLLVLEQMATSIEANLRAAARRYGGR